MIDDLDLLIMFGLLKAGIKNIKAEYDLYGPSQPLKDTNIGDVIDRVISDCGIDRN